MKDFPTFPRKAVATVVAIMGSGLARLGVDVPQYRALLETSLRVDFRGSAQVVSMRRERSPLATALVVYAIYSVMLSFLAFVLPAELYARIILVFGMAILGMMMLVDFGVTLVVPGDVGIIGWRPVSSRTYFAARLTNALFYTVLFSLTLHLIPSLFGIFSKGSSLAFPLVFLPGALLGSLFTAGVVAASYAGLLRVFRQERFRDVVNYVQIALMVFFVVASQGFPRLERSMLRGHSGESAGRTVWSWWDALPPRWFAAPVEMLLQGANLRAILLSLVAVAATGLLFVALIRSLSFSYLERIGQASLPEVERVERRRRASRLGPLLRWLFRSSEERAISDFMRKLLARDRQVRLRLYPMLTYVILPVLPVLLEGERGRPFGGDSSFAIFLPLLALGLLPAVLLSFLPYSGESKGEWIFELAGFEKPARVAVGIKKCLVLIFFLPITLVLVAFFAFFWGLAGALGVVLFALVSGLLLLELEFWMFFRGLPFTRPMTTGRSASSLGYVLVAFALIGIFAATARLFLKTPGRLLLASLILVPVIYLLHRLSNAHYSPEIGHPPGDVPVRLPSE